MKKHLYILFLNYQSLAGKSLTMAIRILTEILRFLPVRSHSLLVRSHFLVLINQCLPLRNHFLALRNQCLPLRNHFLTLRNHFLPLINHSLPLRNECLPLRNHILPLKNTLQTVVRNWKIVFKASKVIMSRCKNQVLLSLLDEIKVLLKKFYSLKNKSFSNIEINYINIKINNKSN